VCVYRIKLGEQQYMDAFNDELNSFKQRIKARAQARLEAAMAEVEEVNVVTHHDHDEIA
jgi:cell division cycle protein 37